MNLTYLIKKLVLFSAVLLVLEGCAVYVRGGYGGYYEPYHSHYHYYGYWR